MHKVCATMYYGLEGKVWSKTIALEFRNVPKTALDNLCAPWGEGYEIRITARWQIAALKLPQIS